MNFSLYIAKRYLFSKSSNHTINIITRIATLGVIVGTLALFIVLSGFSGLRTFSIGFLKTSDPDLKITASYGKSFEYNNHLNNILHSEKGIKFYSKVIEERAFFDYNKKTQIAFIKGVDSLYNRVNKIDTTVFAGTWLDKKIPYGAVVGNGIANKLSVGIFDFIESLSVYVPNPGKGYISNPKNAFSKINTQPIGIFALTDDIDQKYVFVQLPVAQQLLKYGKDQISAIELNIDKNEDVKVIQKNLQNKLGKKFQIKTRAQLNAVFYKMLNTENLTSYLIFTLILIIALFNVIGAVIMMILEKKKNLKTLFNLGTTVKQIKRIFILQGFLLTAFGMIIGLFIGVVLVILQQQYHLFMITKHLAYPVQLTIYNLFLVIITILSLGFLASKIASSRINDKLIS
ncbi:MAG: ABC transporter permease [Lutibacter sp.]